MPPTCSEDAQQLQTIILKKQMMDEDSFLALSQMRGGDGAKSILLMDRGAIDGKIFLSDEAFRNVLEAEALDEATLLTRYDVVFHLVSTAVDAPEHYM